MASKQAMFSGPHAAGIFADMSVDGPEIGTLVLIFDRAKNLPNRKSMGKQNPYCAARLGKEAKKTDIDKRGGQTPRWDQEIRFTVHDSADYFNLKISVFSEDKKTDLIGEAWIKLDDVVVPGGGKLDIWQGLNYKGKYAGELRLEMTYYDTRARPERVRESVAGSEDLRSSRSGAPPKVKRRPLPLNPNNPNAAVTDSLPDPYSNVRTKHGPRDLRITSRAQSVPMESPQQAAFDAQTQQQLQALQQQLAEQQQQIQQFYASTSMNPMEQSPANQQHEEQEQYQEPQVPGAYEDPFQAPDFLPQLPPSNRPRSSLQPKTRTPSRQVPISPLPQRPQFQNSLPHSHSAPALPSSHQEQHGSFDNSVSHQQLRTDYPEPIPDLDFQHSQIGLNRSDVSSNWQQDHHDPYGQQPHFAEPEQYEEEEEDQPPPPPPMHSNSAPAVPQYSSPHGHPHVSPNQRYNNTPPSARHQISNVSPLQSIERTLAQPQQRTPVHVRQSPSGPNDSYHSSPDQGGYNTPQSGTMHQSPSPMPRGSAGRGVAPRNAPVDAYNTPPRPHPLSQEVPRGRSHGPPYTEQQLTSPPDQHMHDGPPIIKPRAISPRPPQEAAPQNNTRPRSSRSSYDIQFPVRAFESSDNNPLSSSQTSARGAQYGNQTSTIRKSVSPRPSMSNALQPSSGVPFGPDSFDVHNPNSREAAISSHASPHSPWQVRADAENVPERKGPIVGWHGQEIDPSDHLPVDSWAPEPEKKTPTKTYGLGRDRDFGPRSAQSVPNSGGRVSRDMLVNVRMKNDSSAPNSQEPSPSPTRNRLTKKNAPFTRNHAPEPLRERDNFNNPIPSPYGQGQEYSRGFRDPSPGPGPYSPHSPYTNSAPHLPPKIPLQSHGYGPDDLSREVASIDIGPGSMRHSRQQSVPTPGAYVPAASRGALQPHPHHRNSYY